VSEKLNSAICVIGGGPAGAAVARRLSQLGHSVVVVEKRLFPRAHIGESLSPGVLPLLDTLGIKERIEHQGFLRPERVLLYWPPLRGYKSLGPLPGFQVDRARFDAIMLEAAGEAGALVLQGAQILKSERNAGGGWDLTISWEGKLLSVERCLVIDASGRRSLMGGKKRRYGSRTLALWNYWRGCAIGGDETRVEAGADQWYWGAPLPDGSLNATVFVDYERFQQDLRQLGSTEKVYAHLLAQSELLAACRQGHPTGPAMVCDATSYTDDDPVATDLIKIGEALFSVDPLSSQGVQAALGTALHAAAVVNTLLRRPEDQALAERFYVERQRESVAFHSSTAGHLYAQVAVQQESAFWKQRAGMEQKPIPGNGIPQPAPLCRDIQLRLAAEACLLAIPCMEEGFIVHRQAVIHPGLSRPIVFLDNVALAPLVECLKIVHTVDEILDTWSRRIPWEQGMKILDWLWNRGLIVAAQ